MNCEFCGEYLGYGPCACQVDQTRHANPWADEMAMLGGGRYVAEFRSGTATRKCLPRPRKPKPTAPPPVPARTFPQSQLEELWDSADVEASEDWYERLRARALDDPPSGA